MFLYLVLNFKICILYFSSNSYDFEYNLNPYAVELTEAQDAEAQREWQAELQAEQEDVASTLPDSNNSAWYIEEEEEMELFNASQTLYEDPPVPVVAPPPEIVPEARLPMSCIVCFRNLANIIALPCRHALVCSDCKADFRDMVCSRCKVPLTELVEVNFT